MKTDQHQATTTPQDAGFPPAPSKAHQQADDLAFEIEQMREYVAVLSEEVSDFYRRKASGEIIGDGSDLDMGEELARARVRLAALTGEPLTQH